MKQTDKQFREYLKNNYYKIVYLNCYPEVSAFPETRRELKELKRAYMKGVKCFSLSGLKISMTAK